MALTLQRMNVASVKPAQSRRCPVRLGRPVVKVSVLGDTTNPFDPSTWKDGAENDKNKERPPTGQAAMKQWEIPPTEQRDQPDAPWVEMAGDGTQDPQEEKMKIPKAPGKWTSEAEEEKVTTGPDHNEKREA